MAELPPPPEGIVLTHFIVSDDVERSRRFYTEVLGGRVERPGDPVNVALANSWIVINGGGGPTDDKPTVIPTGSAASLISGSQTSTPCTPNGAPGVPDSSRRRNSTSTRNAATSAIPTAI
jgi:catechol 2,3-dioxygenase-like lactoylglutathione lyase family enzyme